MWQGSKLIILKFLLSCSPIVYGHQLSNHCALRRYFSSVDQLQVTGATMVQQTKISPAPPLYTKLDIFVMKSNNFIATFYTHWWTHLHLSITLKSYSKQLTLSLQRELTRVIVSPLGHSKLICSFWSTARTIFWQAILWRLNHAHAKYSH